MVTISSLLEDYKKDLVEPIMVLTKLLKVDKSYIYTHIDEKLSEDVVERFNLIMKKREKGHPIQYLLGEKEFMGLSFIVGEGVLVPRNDTEVLVEYLIDYIGESQVEVLDIGFGSGAIGLSLAHYCKGVKVTGVDISEKAIEIANRNIEKFGLRNVKLKKGNLFDSIEKKDFHIIVSNPPYIPIHELEELEKQVREFEPLIALDGGEDGLDFYRTITKKSKQHLEKNGMLIYEVGYNQSEDVRDILLENNFSNIQILNDLQGYERVILGFYR